MRCLINYQLRLGDIVACLPIAKHLADSGNDVLFCCKPEYHAIFETVSYCKPVLPVEFNKNRHQYDKVYDLEIRRAEYDRYRESKIPWRQYIYGKYPEFVDIGNICPTFDRIISAKNYNLPDKFILIAPYGISQTMRVSVDWVIETAKTLGPAPYFVLAPDNQVRKPPGCEIVIAKTLAHLPGLIQMATEFVTINSAPNAIAAGVRKSYYHVYEEGFEGQNNCYYPQQKRIKPPASFYGASWRHVANLTRYKIKSFFLK